MKKCLFVVFLVSGLAHAGRSNAIFPQVTNFGTSVQVTIWNHTEGNVTCSGFVNLSYANGQRQSENVFEYIPSRMTSYRTIYGQQFGERIVMVDHSIFCR
jgi:hypothetical protein